MFGKVVLKFLFEIHGLKTHFGLDVGEPSLPNHAVSMIGRVGLVNFNITFSLSLVLCSNPPDEPL